MTRGRTVMCEVLVFLMTVDGLITHHNNDLHEIAIGLIGISLIAMIDSRGDRDDD